MAKKKNNQNEQGVSRKVQQAVQHANEENPTHRRQNPKFDG